MAILPAHHRNQNRVRGLVDGKHDTILLLAAGTDVPSDRAADRKLPFSAIITNRCLGVEPDIEEAEQQPAIRCPPGSACEYA